ncbi:hypothetical protein VNO77_02290 [Canavalia gladiata]|uniref:Uncharacterized protein n=1 Tax=Canavalia gladiata TaxID=3824 RepID=A0AAN9R5Z6_CANGL
MMKNESFDARKRFEILEQRETMVLLLSFRQVETSVEAMKDGAWLQNLIRIREGWFKLKGVFVALFLYCRLRL